MEQDGVIRRIAMERSNMRAHTFAEDKSTRSLAGLVLVAAVLLAAPGTAADLKALFPTGCENSETSKLA